MYNNQNSVHNPVLQDIMSDLTPQDRHQFGYYDPMPAFNNYSTFKGMPRECLGFDHAFPYSKNYETAESCPNQYEAIGRNVYQDMQYNQHMQQMMNYDSNRNSTKMYNNFGSNYSKEFNESVASPTISSSCEPEKVSGTIQAGLLGNENLVHSTTNASQGQMAQTDDSKPTHNDRDPQIKEENNTTAANHSGDSSILGATKLEEALPAELSALGRSDAQGGPVKIKASDKSAEASQASSPGVRQAVKKRILNSPGDLLENVRETYAYLQGVSFYDSRGECVSTAPGGNYSPTASTVPYAFSVEQFYPDNNVYAPVDKQKLSFNFANTSETGGKFGMQGSGSSHYYAQTGYAPGTTAYHGTGSYQVNNAPQAAPGMSYASYSQPLYPSTPSKAKSRTEVGMQMPATPSTSLNAVQGGSRAKSRDPVDRPAYCEVDAKYTMSPRKTPLTYYDLDDPLESHRPTPATNFYQRNYPMPRALPDDPTPVRVATHPVRQPQGGSVDSDPAARLSNSEEMRQVIYNGKIHNHPLLPLLEDIIIFDMNFPEVAGPFQFFNNVPEQFENLVRNFYKNNRIPPDSTAMIDPEVDAMVTRATRLAHKTIIEKIKREMKKKEKGGGYLLHIQKPPVPDVNGLCDVMSKSNDIGMSLKGQGTYQTHQSSSLDLEDHPVLPVPNTSPIAPHQGYQQSTGHHYPGYQDLAGFHSMVPPPPPQQQQQELVEVKPYRARCNPYDDYPPGQYGMQRTPYDASQNHCQPGTYPEVCPASFTPYAPTRSGGYDNYNATVNAYDSRMIHHPSPYAHAPYAYGHSAQAPHAHPDYMYMGGVGGGGKRDSVPMARKMGRANQPMMLVKNDPNAESEKKGKNKVLPKEAVVIMETWLRSHEENPYPNDEEKDALMRQTKLQINQINYWFTNARRRKLPKWSMERQMAQEKSGNPQNSATGPDEDA